MGSNKKAIIRIFISLVIGVLLLVALIWWTGINEIGEAIGSASPIWLAVSAALVIPTYLLRAIRWKLLLTPVKKNVRVSTTFWSTAVGSMVNTIIPIRLGEFVKAYILGEKEGTGFAPGLSSIVVERTLDMIGLLTIGIFTMFLVSAQASLSDLVVNIFLAVGVLIAVILAVIIAGIKKEDKIISIITRTTSKIPFVKKFTTRIADFASSLIQGLKGLSQNPKMFITNMSLTWILWFLPAAGTYILFIAFNYPMPFVAAILGGTLMALSHILPATPGYVGTYEVFWGIIFFALGVTDQELIIASALTSHLIGFLPVIIIGSISVVWLGMSFEEIFSLKKYTGETEPLTNSKAVTIT